MFRIFPNDITATERNLRSAYTLKLTNLSKGTTAFDLSAILEEISAKTCFIPKKRDSVNYDKERFAIVQFASDQALQAALTFSYVLHNRAIQWAPYTARTCFECGSIHHVLRNCKEAGRQQALQDNNEKYASIYKRFKVQPLRPRGAVSSQIKFNEPYVPGYSPTNELWNTPLDQDAGEWDLPPEISYAEAMKRRPNNSGKGRQPPVPQSTFEKPVGVIRPPLKKQPSMTSRVVSSTTKSNP